MTPLLVQLSMNLYHVRETYCFSCETFSVSRPSLTDHYLQLGLLDLVWFVTIHIVTAQVLCKNFIVISVVVYVDNMKFYFEI